MAGYKPTVRTVLNRERLHEVDLALAKGLEFLAIQTLERADVPDAPVFGEGLVEAGGFISYVDGKRVGGDVQKKPKTFKVRGKGISVAVGFPSPARFNEIGTVNMPARPFFAPAVIAVTGNRGLVEGAIKVGLADFLSKKQAKLARAKGVSSAGRRYAKPAGDPFDFADVVSFLPKGAKGFRR